MIVDLATAADTDRLGRALAEAIGTRAGGAVIILAGELGAGKTALTRATIQALGHGGPVISPSYTLIEPYDLAGRRLYHLDLYRVADPEELEFLGIREICIGSNLVFVEWADRGAGYLPAPDLAIALTYRGSGRSAHIDACSVTGREITATLQRRGWAT